QIEQAIADETQRIAACRVKFYDARKSTDRPGCIAAISPATRLRQISAYFADIDVALCHVGCRHFALVKKSPCNRGDGQFIIAVFKQGEQLGHVRALWAMLHIDARLDLFEKTSEGGSCGHHLGEIAPGVVEEGAQIAGMRLAAFVFEIEAFV